MYGIKHHMVIISLVILISLLKCPLLSLLYLSYTINKVDLGIFQKKVSLVF